jgi:hypothetical protein
MLYKTDFNGIPLATSVPSEFYSAYVTAALWSSTYGENGEFQLDDGEHELSDEAKNKMLTDCANFFNYCEKTDDDNLDPLPEYDCPEYSNAEKSGHDFWLTRNGHGCGYWDRGLGEIGEALSKAAKTFGNCDLYVGDDGLIYAE